MNKTFVCIITGPAGAGKSTISKELALKFERSALIDNDYIRRIVVGGYVRPWPSSDEVKLQESLAVKNIIAMSNNYLKEGFSVFIDIVTGKTNLEMIKNSLETPEIKIFLLLPNEEALLKRFDDRGKGGDELRIRTKDLHQWFLQLKNEIDLTVIDSSDQKIEETVELIFSKL